MAEYRGPNQTVAPGESVIFDITVESCPYGLVRHADGTGSFLLSGGCNRAANKPTYFCTFTANAAVSEGGTAGEISAAIAIDGATIPASVMTVTPAAVENFFNISRAINIPVWRGCCQTISVRNTSNQSIDITAPNIVINRVVRA